MSTDKVTPLISRAKQRELLFHGSVLPLARMIFAGMINPETATRDEFWNAMQTFGLTNGNAFEFHVTRVSAEIALAQHCLDEDAPNSAIVLLFTLIESELNTLVRIHLRIRGFSPNSISDALRGTDFDTKIDVILPLLEVGVPARMRNTAFQCKAIRNLIVHNKASPNLIAIAGDKASDEKIAKERASKFFAENPLERIQNDLQVFIDNGIFESKAIQYATTLFDRYYDA